MVKESKNLLSLKLGSRTIEIASLSTYWRDLKSRKVLPFLILLILIGFAYLFKSQFVSAVVNGKPIWRLSLVKELEKQSGQKMLDFLVTKTLILQEAKKQKVTVSDEEVNQEIKKIEESLVSQNQTLDQVLGLQGMNREELEEQVQIQKLIEKMVGGQIQVTDEEIESYFTENKDLFGKDATLEKVKEDIRKQLLSQKQSEETQTWLTSLRENARIQYWNFAPTQ